MAQQQLNGYPKALPSTPEPIVHTPLIIGGLTIAKEAIIYGIRRVRLVGINTPEIGEEGYKEAKEFVNTTCWGEAIKLDVDDMKQYDAYYRILAVVYVNGANIHRIVCYGKRDKRYGTLVICFVILILSFVGSVSVKTWRKR